MNRLKQTDSVYCAYSLLLLLFSLAVLYGSHDAGGRYHFFLCIGCLAAYVMCIHTWVRSTHKIFSVFVLFVVYALFSNMGQSFAYILNLNLFEHNLYSEFSKEAICNMLRFQFAAIAALNFGVSLYFAQCRNIITKNELEIWNDNTKEQKTQLDLVLYNIFLISAAWVLLYCLWQLLQRQSMSYSELYNSRSLLAATPQFLFVLVGLILALKKQRIKTVYMAWIVATGMLLIAGTRSMAIIYVGALIACASITHHQFFTKKYAIWWGAAFVFGFAMISALSTARRTAIGSGSFEFNLLYNLNSTLHEMGASAKPILYTMKYIDNGGEHYQTILFTLFHGVLPTAVTNFFGLNKWNVHLGTWVTAYSGITYTELGYSFIAEAYMNYGNVGWLFMIIYGAFIAFAENTAYKRIVEGGYLYPAVMILLLSKQVFFARGNLELIDTFYRYSFYVFIFWIIVTAARNGGKVPIRSSVRRKEI